ncbi:MAG: signal peptidase I [Promethearchaeota archaeon]
MNYSKILNNFNSSSNDFNNKNNHGKNNHKTSDKKIPKKKIIISIALIAFAFIGSYLIYFVLQITLNTEKPVVVVISGSMEPTLYKGDLLFVRGENPANIKNGTIEDKQGDIVVYDARDLWPGAPQDPIVHRIVDKYLDNGIWYFRTKGDANAVPDPVPVPQNRIYGVVCGRIPYIGWVKIILTDTGLLIPVIVIISILLVISIAWDLVKKDESEEKNENKDNNI